MDDLNTLKRQLSIILVKSIDSNGVYRSAKQICKDIGSVYQKFYIAGVSTSVMKLLDKVFYNVVENWDRLVREELIREKNERNKSSSNGSQTIENKESIEGYKVLVGRTDQEFISLL